MTTALNLQSKSVRSAGIVAVFRWINGGRRGWMTKRTFALLFFASFSHGADVGYRWKTLAGQIDSLCSTCRFGAHLHERRANTRTHTWHRFNCQMLMQRHVTAKACWINHNFITSIRLLWLICYYRCFMLGQHLCRVALSFAKWRSARPFAKRRYQNGHLAVERSLSGNFVVPTRVLWLTLQFAFIAKRCIPECLIAIGFRAVHVFKR